MAKPATTFTWATDATWVSGPNSGEATTDTPSSGALSERAQGFVAGTTFPANWANWVLNVTGQWVEWANTYAAGLELNNTFAGNNTFDGTVDFNSSVTFDGAVDVQAQTITQTGATYSGAATYSGNNTHSGNNTFDGTTNFSGLVDIEDGTPTLTVGANNTRCRITNSHDAARSFGIGATETVATYATSTGSAFSIMVQTHGWEDGGSHPLLGDGAAFFVVGHNDGGTVAIDSSTMGSSSNGVFTYAMDVSGTSVRVRATNASGGGITANHVTTLHTTSGDLTQ